MQHWSKDSFFYHIYTLGFCGALYKNDFSSPSQNRLEKIYSWIDHLKYLGVNALYLGPLFESTFHGYDTADFYWVDRRLGTNENLKDLIAVLHNNGIKVILDGVFNHVGRNFWAFRDLLAKRESSPYCSWFKNLDFSSNNQFNDHFSYEGWNGHYDLVKLNLQNSDTKEHILNAVKMWIEYFDIDGLRIDAADCVDLNFLKELSETAKLEKTDFWMVGEIIHGDYRRWANSQTLDSVTNYECYKGLYSSHNDKNYFEIAYSLKRQFGEKGIYKDIPLYTFADNHDVNRIASTLKNPVHIYPLHCLLFTMPGVPSVYYGSEWGIKGLKQNGSDISLRPSLDLNNSKSNEHYDLQNTINKLSRIRYLSPALKYGNYKELLVSQEQFAFIREYENEKILVILNSSKENLPLELSLKYEEGTRYIDLLNNQEEYFVNNNKLKIDSLPSCWACILRACN